MFGYVFRFIVLTIVIITLVISFKTLVKKSAKRKILNVLIIFNCLIVLFLSFISLDIKEPKIDNNISLGIDAISNNFSPKTDSPKIYNTYEFDCDGYYGTVAVSKVDQKEKKEVFNNKNKFALVIEDGTAIALCSHVVCTRDVFGLPNYCVGTVKLFKGNTRVFVKFNYENEKLLGPIKYLTFTQYFYKEIIDIEEIANSISTDSLVVLDQSD